jgi:SAM-dependent methyltransferase
MNTAQIKAYAPQARRDFIKAVTSRGHLLGLDSKPEKIKPVVVKGDVAFINGQVFPAKVSTLRKSLEARISKEGFDQVMEHVAYTWFNRFMALRYMELHGYLSHGCRVLSNPSGSPIPEILEHALDIELPGLNREEVMELKLAGNKDEELYALLIKVQCHALYRAMPFLFERLDDETELLLPDNLLSSGSVVRKLVEEIDEDSWDKVEIIGWIYQFYISEKKEQVIGKVVKSEDIPAATQLFTPNWIVKYMVQNSLGRMWLATYPDSPLRAKMEYYIEPAEQTPEVQAQIDAITPKSLNPEEITLLDPACGSGHILVEAYDIFKEIYLERGYRTKDIPRLILEKNMYGLDIDDRAAQLTGFALMMKARADNHNLFNLEKPIDLGHFRSIVSSAGLDAEVIADALLKETTRPLVDDGLLFPETKKQQVLVITEKPEVKREHVIAMVDLFRNAKTFGSLITIPDDLVAQLPALYDLVNKDYRDDWNKQDKAEMLKPIVEQASILARKYNCVVANPPYMGNKGMTENLKELARTQFLSGRSDLFAMFIEQGLTLTKNTGLCSMVTMHSWMFLSSFEDMRKRILDQSTISVLAHFGAKAFTEISGEVVQTAAFSFYRKHINGYIPSFDRLVDVCAEEKKSILASGSTRIQL